MMALPFVLKVFPVRVQALFVTFCLLACAPLPPGGADTVSPPGAAPDLAACGAADLMPLVGGPVSALPATGGWGALRIIHPGDAVTEDFSETRLNVEVDGQETILRLSCG
jgi:hypothetical protein